MIFRSEDPPAPGNIPVETPPLSDKPTTAMLKADIDSGRTGDKIPHYDVGLSQLGTDDEAAGNSPSSDRIALARKTEAASPQLQASLKADSKFSWGILIFVSALIATGLGLGFIVFAVS